MESRLEKGFTFIELLCVLTIIASLTLASLSSLSRMKEKNDLDYVEKRLIFALKLARTKAILMNRPIKVIPFKNNWSQGLTIFTAKKENPILILDWSNRKIVLSWQGFISSRYLIFSRDLLNEASSGHFLLKTPRGLRRKIVLNRLGHLRIVLE